MGVNFEFLNKIHVYVYRYEYIPSDKPCTQTVIDTASKHTPTDTLPHTQTQVHTQRQSPPPPLHPQAHPQGVSLRTHPPSTSSPSSHRHKPPSPSLPTYTQRHRYFTRKSCIPGRRSSCKHSRQSRRQGRPGACLSSRLGKGWCRWSRRRSGQRWHPT